jgi:hypothetical protein
METAGPHIEALVDFLWSRSKRGPDIEKPSDHAAWQVANRIQWFATGASSDFLRDPLGPHTLCLHGAVQIPVHRGQSFRRIADSVPVIADSFR